MSKTKEITIETPLTIKVVHLTGPKDIYFSYVETGNEFGFGPGEGKTIAEALRNLAKLIDK